MKILLAQNLIHLPSHGGASRSNRLMLEELARRGHICLVAGPLTGALAAASDPDACRALTNSLPRPLTPRRVSCAGRLERTIEITIE